MAGTLVIDTLTDGSGNSTSATAAIRGSAKAWVTVLLSSSPSVAASHNVSSVTFVSGGQFTVNFTSSFSDTQYATIGSTVYPSTNSYNQMGGVREDSVRRTKTTAACPVAYYDTISGQISPSINAYIAFFR